MILPFVANSSLATTPPQVDFVDSSTASPSSSSSSSYSSSVTAASSFASSQDSSNSFQFSALKTASPRCHGLDLLVKAIHQVTAGLVIGVPYIQRRKTIRRRRRIRGLEFDAFMLDQLSSRKKERVSRIFDLYMRNVLLADVVSTSWIARNLLTDSRGMKQNTNKICWRSTSQIKHYGGNIYDIKMNIDGQNIFAGRFLPFQSFVDPTAFYELVKKESSSVVDELMKTESSPAVDDLIKKESSPRIKAT